MPTPSDSIPTANSAAAVKPAAAAKTASADTASTDTASVAADSVAAAARDTASLPALNGVAPWTLTQSEDRAPWSAAERKLTNTASAAYKSGLEGMSRPVGYGENSWLSAIILCMLVLLALNFKNCARIFAGLPQDLFGVRRRSNAFDEHTANETRTYLLILLLLFLSQGILIFSAITATAGLPASFTPFSLTMVCSAGAAIFYLGQLAIYKLIGYSFTDSISAGQWTRGFNASQCVLSFLLLIPALIAIYYPDVAQYMVAAGAICYILARILFISKGFRIFYINFPSILYFILYLCALEIAPLIFIARMAAFLAYGEPLS